ncbi:sugar transporter [Colletotrichum scovillei]|uniref:Sugar transporter n=1 Tax=Colletotrichum scovillei TaxID=1209932 RepID=A0A9P7UGV3_9PEZI|nr:sugar transporter [Colletotrichum scovillei]KAG7075299.1 sugar transporter [Colletotrichum scovillei]KAG7082519.1 sugar transporter [Colletotrichum scovillei]
MATAVAKPPYFGLKGKWLTYWITFACSVDMLMFGYDQAVFSGVIVTDDFLELHDLVGPEKTRMLSTITAIYDIGCFVGAILAFTIGESLGRTKSILIGTAIMSIGAILMASSYSLAQMFVGRIVLGIGNGVNTATAPIWQTETAPAHWRGKLVMFEMMMNIVGFSLCNWINFGLSYAGGAVAWRFPLAFQFVFIIALFAAVPWLPESPRWLMSHGREEEATLILACLEAKPEDDAFVISQKEEIRFSIDYEREHHIRWRDLLRPDPGATKPLRRIILGAGTQFMQQFEGINIMSYYMPAVLISAVDLSNELARLLTAANSLTYLIFSCVSVTLVERWGRRGLMLLSTAGQGLAFLVITILLRYGGPGGNRRASEGSIVFFFLYFMAFGLGMLGVPWLYPTEINSIAMRTKGAAVATATNWMTNYVIVQITPIGIQDLGWKFWIVFTVLNAAFLPVIYLFYPETANRTLEDLDEYYRNNPPLFVIGDKDAIASQRPKKYVDRQEAHVQRVAHENEITETSENAVLSGEKHQAT